MSTVHNIDILNCKEIWEGIKEYHVETVRRQKKKKNSIMKVKRTVYLEYWGPRLKYFKDDTNTKFEKLYPKRLVK